MITCHNLTLIRFCSLTFWRMHNFSVKCKVTVEGQMVLSIRLTFSTLEMGNRMACLLNLTFKMIIHNLEVFCVLVNSGLILQCTIMRKLHIEHDACVTIESASSATIHPRGCTLTVSASSYHPHKEECFMSRERLVEVRDGTPFTGRYGIATDEESSRASMELLIELCRLLLPVVPPEPPYIPTCERTEDLQPMTAKFAAAIGGTTWPETAMKAPTFSARFSSTSMRATPLTTLVAFQHKEEQKTKNEGEHDPQYASNEGREVPVLRGSLSATHLVPIRRRSISSMRASSSTIVGTQSTFGIGTAYDNDIYSDSFGGLTNCHCKERRSWLTQTLKGLREDFKFSWNLNAWKKFEEKATECTHAQIEADYAGQVSLGYSLKPIPKNLLPDQAGAKELAPILPPLRPTLWSSASHL
eukprot:TsM_000288400 transcript=TsM_000288400 gene=TsM_000288400